MDDPAVAPIDLSEQATVVKDARWTLEIQRTDPKQMGSSMRKHHSGQEAVSVEDLSLESREALRTRGSVEWKAILSTRSFDGRRTRYLVFVEDATATHLDDVHSSAHCAFGRSWKAFNEQRQGHAHRALSWCSWLLGVFLIVGSAVVYAVYAALQRSASEGTARIVAGHGFHRIVAAKFALQDVPQQVCIVLYILGWYEASGLRCQLCLFNPLHCGQEDAFHFANAVAFSCCLLSSVANQLLIRPVIKKTYTEDDICLQYTIRICGVCIAVLPFTTGLCLASGSILPMPRLFHLVFALPCCVGWLTLAMAVCVPAVMCCDEGCDDEYNDYASHRREYASQRRSPPKRHSGRR